MSKWKEFVEATKKYWTKEDRYDVSKPFPSISINNLRLGDGALYYFGNKITAKQGSSWRSAKYGYADPCPFHANSFYDYTKTHNVPLLLDTEIRATYSSLQHEYMSKSSYRIDIIRPRNITVEQQEQIMAYIEEVAGKEPYYGVRRYAGFVKQMPFWISWASKLMKPKPGELVCSNRVVEAWMKAGIKCGDVDFKDMAPVDILIYALRHPDEFEIFTLKERSQE